MPSRSEIEYSKFSEDFSPSGSESLEPVPDSSESDLTLDDLRGDADESDVIEALTEGDIRAAESAESETPAPAAAPAPSPSPEPPAAPRPADTTPNNSGMSLESFTRAREFAEGREPIRIGHAFYCGGAPDPNAEIDALLAGLDSDEPAPEAEPQPAPKPDPERDLSKLVALLRDGRIKADEKSKKRTAEAIARIEAARLDRKRDRTRERVKKHRAAKRAVAGPTVEQILDRLDTAPLPKSVPRSVTRQYHKRLGLLLAATANHKGDKRLIRIRGREAEITDAWVIGQDAREKLGEDASQSAVARLHPDKSMTKRRVQSLREIISKLEAAGGPWCDL